MRNPNSTNRLRPSPVTIIVGIITRDGIVLASDSQITSGTSKQTDASKISIISFQNNLRVMVAQSGAVDLSSRLVEILEQIAEKTPISDYRQVGESAQTAMRQLRQELRAQRCDCSMAELDDWRLQHQLECEIMMGFFVGEKPHLYSINLNLGIPARFRSYYGTSGCGGTLGQFLLAEHSEPEMETDLATAIAIYAVDTVKKHDAFCGGKTRVGVMQLAPAWWSATTLGPKLVSIWVPPEEKIEEISKLIQEADIEAKKSRNQKLHAALKENAQRRIGELLNALLEENRKKDEKPK